MMPWEHDHEKHQATIAVATALLDEFAREGWLYAHYREEALRAARFQRVDLLNIFMMAAGVPAERWHAAEALLQ